MRGNDRTRDMLWNNKNCLIAMCAQTSCYVLGKLRGFYHILNQSMLWCFSIAQFQLLYNVCAGWKSHAEFIIYQLYNTDENTNNIITNLDTFKCNSSTKTIYIIAHCPEQKRNMIKKEHKTHYICLFLVYLLSLFDFIYSIFMYIPLQLPNVRRPPYIRTP